MNEFALSLARSPELFPLALDTRSDSVTLVGLTRQDYVLASFLDERALPLARSRRVVPCSEIELAVDQANLPEAIDYIFHIGHVGSTLLSRLIGAHPCAFSLREPAILRTLAQIHSAHPQSPGPWNSGTFERRLSAFVRLYSRTFDADARAIVKATSFVSELAPGILTRRTRPRALLVFVRPESYLATILGGENAPMESKALAPMRLQRLEKRLGHSLARAGQFSLGETIALGWLCEMTALAVARRAGAAQTLLVDFERFLAAPEVILSACLSHLGLAVSDNTIAAIVSSPLMRRYAKAPEHAYDTALRAAVLAQARATRGEEIRRGLDWIESLAKEHPLVEEALALSGT